MAVCDLSTGIAKLTRAAKRLREQWDSAKAQWRDQNAVDFEQNHLASIPPQLNLTTAAVNRLAELLVQMERDCSEREEN